MIKNLAGQTVIYGLGTIVPRLLNYLLTPFLTYGFTAAEFGINSELFAYISFLNVVFTYGMETTFFNFRSRMEDKNTVFSTAMVSILSSTFMLTLLLLLFSGTIADALSTPNAVYLTRFITWSVLIVATDALMAIPFARLRAEQKALKFSLLKLLNVVINFSLTIFFLRVCKQNFEAGGERTFAGLYDPEVGIGYAFLAGLIANIVTLAFLARDFGTIRMRADTALLKQMLSYAWPLVILGLAGMVNETLDRIILKKLLPDKAAAQTALGIYGACYKIAILMTIFRQAFQFAAEPFFFNRAKEKDATYAYAVVMKYFIIFCLFIFLATMLNMGWIKYFIGENFRSGLAVVPILLVANICLGVVYNLSIWFKLSGKTQFGAIIALSGAAITIILNVIFVPRYSYMACAWATLAAYFGMMVISYFLGQRYYPVRYNLRAVLLYSAIAALLWITSFSYAGMENEVTKTLFNNLLIAFFAWLVYKLEFNSIRKLSANARNQDKDR